uniref:Uncharacterized protein n=1 Tax=Tanacetum cinerariifolium TaxID=118510 RepID=A0A6L2NDQ7_TANCI|nr:hypothetical protein [Tanacetum cinerariifolium]
MRFIPQHEVVQKYDAILPDNLTNQAMKESKAYKTYYGLATGKVTPKLKSKIYFHSSYASGSGADEGTGVSPGVLDVPTYGYEDEQISWKSSDDEDDDEVSMSKDDDDDAKNDDGQDDDNEQTKSDNDGDDFVHPKFSIHDEEERQDEEDKDKDGLDMRVYTPSHYESTNDEAYDDVTQGDNVEEEKLDEEEDVNELYRDMNVNLEGRDTEMTDTLLPNSSSLSSGFISNMLNPNMDTSIDSILNLNTESTSLVDVHVTTHVEMPPSSVTTLPPPPIPLVEPQYQTPVLSPTVVPSTSLQNLPTIGSLFKFEDRLKALEDNFLEFKQTNLYVEAVSSIPNIVDTYLTNKMNEAVKTVVQLQPNRLRNKAQAENEDFINKLDENIKKIIKEQVKVQVKEQVFKILLKIEKFVNEHLEAEVLTHSSNEAKTSHVVATKLSELELKKILIDKIESNKSIHRSDQQKTLCKALVDAYETDKVILETYGDTVTFKRCRDDEDIDEEPSA